MWSRRNLAEDHILALDEELYSEDTVSAESVGDSLCDLLSLLDGNR